MASEELLIIAIGVAAIPAAVLAVWSVLAVRSAERRARDAMVRFEVRLEEQGKREAAMAVRIEERLFALEKVLADGQARSRASLERRLGDLQTGLGESAGALRLGLVERFDALQLEVASHLADGRTMSVRSLGELREQVKGALGQYQTRFEQRQAEAVNALQETLHSGMERVQKQVADALSRSAEDLGKRVDGLTRTTDERLREISGAVEKRLADGFEKTTATFADVLKRLALIDEAQKRITELSTNVVSLQEVLADKRSRGAFGEVQLTSLVRNVMPESSFALQHTLSNGRVADCALFLPEPTGTIAIDAKFPLESYRAMTDVAAGDTERKSAERQFKIDIRKHIHDIAQRYIVAGETSDGAVMFIPAEAVFAEIQAHHADLVQESHEARVWMVSPTTLMAILNTARAVLKDEATRKQVHVIQEHLGGLAKDFDRFRKRMDDLSRHIKQASEDVDRVHVSARKITNRFEKIERVELDADEPPALDQENASN